MIVFILLPLISLLLVFLIIHQVLMTKGELAPMRVALAYSTLITGLFIVGTTELLSVLHSVTFAFILTAWTIFLAVLIVIARRAHVGVNNLKKVLNDCGAFARRNRVIFIFLAILTISLLLAVIYPPNNYDSLTYHMARVEHWIQNRSVENYATIVVRQLIYPPFAEWIILHIQLLTGTDRFANAVQTVFFGGCILQVSLIIFTLGGNKRRQMLGALFACLLPMAVIQSNTTQNDIVVAYFSLVFVFCNINAVRTPSLINLILAGTALGLALLTKGTAYLFSLAFIGWYALAILKLWNQPLNRMLRLGVRFSLVPIIALCINIGHYYRNVQLTGQPLGNSSHNLANERHSVRGVAFVALKNYMNHMPIDGDVERAVTRLGLKIGIDADDPVYSTNKIIEMMHGFSFHEDYAQNFWHTILVTVAVVLFFSQKKLYTEPLNMYRIFVLSLLGIAILFCVMFKWQPWSNRLETTLFMYCCVFLGIIFGNLWPWLKAAMVFIAMIFAVAGLTTSDRHPVFPIAHSIFRQPYSSFIYYNGMYECSRFLDTTSIKTFGLYIGADSPDYPFYKMLAESKEGRRPMKHMFVENESAKFADKRYYPDAIISLEALRDKYTIDDRVYYRTRRFGETLALFEPKKP